MHVHAIASAVLAKMVVFVQSFSIGNNMDIKALAAEFVGTAILILLGNGVVANVVLNKTKGNGGGPIVITFGWGMAVFVGVFCFGKFSGAHLNPAVTIAVALAHRGNFTWAMVPGYIIAQMLGAMLGAACVYLFYRPYFGATDDADTKMACFCTSPGIRDMGNALFCEVVGTFVLIMPIFLMVDPSLSIDLGAKATTAPQLGLGAIGALPTGLLVFAIGMSLGGTTGYAINPARDLGPRIMHAILPIRGKRDSDWGYAWVPIVGPIIGAILAALAAQAFAGQA
jgi:glycerol uptake facilitator protein